MANADFSFRKFSISHNNSTMKIGTDSVVLGGVVAHSSLITPPIVDNVLDIGCGCGVLALISAQFFTKANVVGIDIDSQSVDEANRNFVSSPWPERCRAMNISLQDFFRINTTKYEIIISNPPYFVNSCKPLNITKSIARHTDSLPLDDLAEGVSYLLSNNGVFSCIFPVTTGELFVLSAMKYGLVCINEIRLFSKSNSPNPERLILFFSKSIICKNIENHYLLREDGDYSDWYYDVVQELR